MKTIELTETEAALLRGIVKSAIQLRKRHSTKAMKDTYRHDLKVTLSILQSERELPTLMVVQKKLKK
jgi:hypothetical protein